MMINFEHWDTNINKLRTPTVLEKATDTRTGNMGGVTRTYVPITGTIWVNDQVRRTTYTIAGSGLVIDDRHWVTMRYRGDITAGSKFRFNGPFGVWYVQLPIDPKNDRHWLVCVCTEVAP